MTIEMQAVLTAMFASIIFGYLYEVIRRSIVLGVTFVLLCFSMLIPQIPAWRGDDFALAISRVLTVVMVQGIIQNPLLLDYVKRRNRGWANGFQQLGYTIGEIFSFVLIALEVYKDPDTAATIFYVSIGIIFFLGLFVVFFMVKDTVVPRTYVMDKDGKMKRWPQKLQVDDDENDTGDEVDLGIPDGAIVAKAKKKNCCGKVKLILN